MESISVVLTRRQKSLLERIARSKLAAQQLVERCRQRAAPTSLKLSSSGLTDSGCVVGVTGGPVPRSLCWPLKQRLLIRISRQ
jgi:hypothetical protein